jgi:2-oxoglutarate ferredoxin oxidoreductase subunit alpha
MDEIVGHMREGIDVEELKDVEVINRALPDMDNESWLPYKADENSLVPEIPPFGAGKRYHITGLIHDERGFPTSNVDKAHDLCIRLMQKIEKNKKDIITFDKKNIDDADIVIVCYGGTARSAIGAMKKARKNGAKVGMFRAITIWPFPEEALDAISDKIAHIIVAEHNYGQIVHEVERVSKGRCKVHHIGKVNGTIIMPEEIIQLIREINNEQ